MESDVERGGCQGLVIVGAGPGGLAPLFAAASEGLLQDVLDVGVTVLERGQRPGEGALGAYAIDSDSSAVTFLDIVRQSREPRLLALQTHPAAQAIASYGTRSAPLEVVGRFLSVAGTVLCELVAESARGMVLMGAEVREVQQTGAGLWRTQFVAGGRAQTVFSSSVVLATGADQPVRRLEQEGVAGLPLLPTYAPKVLQSGDVLTAAGMAEVARRLAGMKEPRVAIVGGSTSAAAVALALCTKLHGVSFGVAGVRLLHRRPLRIFYETVQAAHADGYTAFGPDDVCPLSGRVFRLSGFRLQSREFMMGCLGIAGRPPEPRVRLIDMRQTAPERVQQTLRESDLIVAAMGYRPRLLRVVDRKGDNVALRRPTSALWSVVDAQCRLLRADGTAIAGVFATGLATGPTASRELGGELGHKGQVNSLWLWQHALGEKIVRQVLVRARAAAAAPEAQAGGVFSGSFLADVSGRHAFPLLAGAKS